ncbi:MULTISPECIES: hypothetical protein [unclassified Moorena]|uniref:calcium-binding protein n=1 Tax=unclassified Moorena TaxID=2683338 RepID=UPI0013FFD7A3|nr:MULTISPECIES: hypothetical protein [unclassified Moorena]NEO15478.1 hypothetical protein [Moorena sp. SIO3E8]NEP98495.1 hypothetical protein [Moorena sp. SIO3F7]
MSTNSTNTIVLTFDELPFQPVDDLSFMGVTFDFKVDGVDSTDANYADVGPGSIFFVQDPSLEGDAAGILTLDFDAPVSELEFGVALSTFGTLTPGFTVELFDGSTLVDEIEVDTSSLPIFTEGLFSFSDRDTPIDRVVIDFDDAAAFRFALDNLSFEEAGVTLIGTSNNDILEGGGGDDIIKGLNSKDLLIGLAGEDYMDGGDGDDLLFGGNGHDTLKGGNGQDTLIGGAHDDILEGGKGDDWLYGQEGDDLLNGGQGQDQLLGGFGNDTLIGGPGDDILTGGSGQDTFVLSTVGKVTITDFTDGEDLLQLDGLTFGQISIFEQNDDTIITTINNQPLAVLSGVDFGDITEADFVL